MRIIPCGTIVTIKPFNIQGVITCVQISYEDIKYEVMFNNNGAISLIWLKEQDFGKDISRIREIGFK